MMLFGKDVSRETVVIAEVGVNHEGSIEAAKTIISAIADTSVDAVKLQSYTPARYASASDRERLERVSKFALNENEHLELIAFATSAGLRLISTPLTEDWVPFLAGHCEAIKIASGDLTFEPVIRAAARTGRRVLLSTGCGTVEEIDVAVGWIKREVGDKDLSDRLVLMHCVSAYPVPIEQANILSIPFLKERYGVPVGYSNHVVGPEAVYGAVALGAQVIEVHVTDRREDRTFRDHELSFEPAELADLVKRVHAIRNAVGEYGKTVQQAEEPLRLAIRKGVVAARNLEAGTILSSDDLMFARPATEFDSSELPRLIGKRLNSSIGRGETLMRNNVGDPS